MLFKKPSMRVELFPFYGEEKLNHRVTVRKLVSCRRSISSQSPCCFPCKEILDICSDCTYPCHSIPSALPKYGHMTAHSNPPLHHPHTYACKDSKDLTVKRTKIKLEMGQNNKVWNSLVLWSDSHTWISAVVA